MAAKLIQNSVGPWPMNTYAVICEATRTSAIIDPGAEPERILESVKDTRVDKILLTHGHLDHVGVLEAVKDATAAPVYLHPRDSEKFRLNYDQPLAGNQILKIGNLVIQTIHTPGHTPGQISFNLGDGRVIVGDTIFVGGPGKTWSPEDFETTMRTMREIVFKWPDKTRFFPGHGPSGQIGAERFAFEAFAARGWPSSTFGDVAWRK
ncbi:MAG: MBL fold metallo-hydrolase [Chloroflexota bacterium]